MTRRARDPVTTLIGAVAATIMFAGAGAFVAFTIESFGQPWPDSYGPGAALCALVACASGSAGAWMAMRVWRDA